MAMPGKGLIYNLRKYLSEKLHNLYSSPSSIRVLISKDADKGTRTQERHTVYNIYYIALCIKRFWLEKLMERDQAVLEETNCMCTGVRCQAFVVMVMNLCFHKTKFQLQNIRCTEDKLCQGHAVF
jgi:hypothetical protein